MLFTSRGGGLFEVQGRVHMGILHIQMTISPLPAIHGCMKGLAAPCNTVLRTYQVDLESGAIHDALKTISFGAHHGGTVHGVAGNPDTPLDISDTVRFAVEERLSEDMGTAHRYSQLKDINQFRTAEGVFLLDQPQTITIHQGGREVRVTLYADDEVVAVVDRINQAIYEGLGQQAIVGEENRYKFTSFVNSPIAIGGNEAMSGSVVIRSAVPGSQGELVFSGEEAMMRALGLNIIQDARDNSYLIDVRNMDSGAVLAEGIRVSGNEASGVLSGVNLHLDSVLGIEGVEYERCSGEFRHITGSSEAIYIRLADMRRLLHVGANAGQTVRLDLGDISSNALGIADENLFNRDLANRAIKKIDRAIAQVSAHRTNLGVLEYRLEHTVNNLAVSSVNLVQAESRIRDADIAREFMKYIREKLLTEIGYMLMAQVNMQRESVLHLIS